MILINSAKFIVSDLQAEFGKIPPAFMPFGSKRLYVHQASVLKRSFLNEEIYLSLPSDYQIPKSDQEFLQLLGITVIQNSSQLSLRESVNCSLLKIDQQLESIRILHGDTLFSELPQEADLINVTKPKSQQSWFSEEVNPKGEIVWSGYFAFSDPELLLESLSNENDFESAVLSYDKNRPMKRNLAISWQDFGHSSTYYLARQSNLVTRKFNHLEYDNGILRKSGDDLQLSAEVSWYREIPTQLRKFTPQLIHVDNNSGSSSYSMEYLPIPALSEIFVYGHQSTLFWMDIFSLIDELLDTLRKSRRNDLVSVENIEYSTNFEKHLSRRLVLLDSSDCPINQDDKIIVNGEPAISIHELAIKCLEIMSKEKVVESVVHGDLCLGNILFESRMNQIRLIDPRGQNFEGIETIYGDQRYDLAKLAHSVIGNYDSIIAEHFYLKHSKFEENWVLDFTIWKPENYAEIESLFFKKFLENYTNRESVIAIMILLFISMIPLHSEDPKRQLAFISNSISLHYQFFRESK